MAFWRTSSTVDSPTRLCDPPSPATQEEESEDDLFQPRLQDSRPENDDDEERQVQAFMASMMKQQQQEEDEAELDDVLSPLPTTTTLRHSRNASRPRRVSHNAAVPTTKVVDKAFDKIQLVSPDDFEQENAGIITTPSTQPTDTSTPYSCSLSQLICCMDQNLFVSNESDDDDDSLVQEYASPKKKQRCSKDASNNNNSTSPHFLQSRLDKLRRSAYYPLRTGRQSLTKQERRNNRRWFRKNNNKSKTTATGADRAPAPFAASNTKKSEVRRLVSLATSFSSSRKSSDVTSPVEKVTSSASMAVGEMPISSPAAVRVVSSSSGLDDNENMMAVEKEAVSSPVTALQVSDTNLSSNEESMDVDDKVGETKSPPPQDYHQAPGVATMETSTTPASPSFVFGATKSPPPPISTVLVHHHQQEQPTLDDDDAQLLHYPTPPQDRGKDRGSFVPTPQQQPGLLYYVLLVEPVLKIFEVVRVEVEENEPATVGDVLSLARAAATDPTLQRQRYTSLCTPSSSSSAFTEVAAPMIPMNLLMEPDSGNGTDQNRHDMLLAVPEHSTAATVRAIYRVLMKNPRMQRWWQQDDPFAEKQRSNKKKSSRDKKRRRSRRTPSSTMQQQTTATMDG